jgi:hypothetical protein
MEKNKYNKLAVIGFILSPGLVLLLTITSRLGSGSFGLDLVLAYPSVGLFLGGLLLAIISLFKIKRNEKGKSLAIITITYTVVEYFLPRLLLSLPTVF